MPHAPFVDVADYLPAVPLDAAIQWPGALSDGGRHVTAYGLSAFASRSDYPQETPILVGDSLQRVHLSVWLRDGVEIASGSKAVRVDERGVVMAFTSGEPLRTRFGGLNHHVGLLLPPELLHRLAAAQAERLLTSLRLNGCLRAAAGHARVLRAAHELEAVLLDTASSALLREAKSLELLALMLEAGAAAPQPAMPGGRQQALLRRARELLLQDLADAPSIDELARACGLNAFQLKQGFKCLFGMSVHALYQQERMQHAWRLIESGRANATEAGRLVGYTNASHFSAAFRKAFGVLPSALKGRAAVSIGKA